MIVSADCDLFGVQTEEEALHTATIVSANCDFVGVVRKDAVL